MRHCLQIGLVLTALIAVSPAPLLAADAHGHEPTEAAATGIEKGLFKGAIDLSLWTIVVFLVLLAVLYKFAWGPILDGLKQREEGIARDKAEAEHARRQAVEAKAKTDEELARVHAEIGQMIAKARADAQAAAAEDLARGKAELQAEKDRLRHEMQTEKDQIVKDVYEKTIQIATLIALKGVGKQITFDDQRGLLNESLAEFRAAGQARVKDLESARA